jgi:predicted DNA binding CopG/RHH family protein
MDNESSVLTELVGLFLFKNQIMKSKKLTVRLPSEAASKLKIIAAQTGRNMQDIIGQAVSDWLAKNGGEA